MPSVGVAEGVSTSFWGRLRLSFSSTTDDGAAEDSTGGADSALDTAGADEGASPAVTVTVTLSVAVT
jgi:hypothetical protein